MNELINLVSQKTGLDSSKSQMAVTTVINYLKDRLPANIRPIIDQVAGGQNASNTNLGDLEKGLGGIFGKK